MNRTIAALSTPAFPSGLGVIRVSGDNAVKIASEVFIPTGGRRVEDMAGYTASFGKICFGEEQIDEGVLLIFRAPHSYTGEDVAEISCHGGLYVINRTLRALFACGAVPAEPGEFTKRAFLNGKMDLTEAEAVMSLIGARGEDGAKAALSALKGALGDKIRGISQVIAMDCASLGAWVDYPDEEIEDTTREKLLRDCQAAKNELDELLKGYGRGKLLIDGVDTCIAGKPNVGKSTLMNFLTGFDRSIVTDTAGTTRDVVEDRVSLGGLVLNLADTAGIRDTENEIEKIGVDFALKRMADADLILAVFDGSRPADETDLEIIEKTKNNRAVAVVNKDDLNCLFDASLLSDYPETVFISAKNSSGREALTQAVERVLSLRSVDTSSAMLSNERQRLCCEEAKRSLNEAIDALEGGVTLDAVTVCMEDALDSLLSLTGQKAEDKVVEQIFSRFCVGK